MNSSHKERQGRLRHVLACDERKRAARCQRAAALAAARAQQLRNGNAAAEDISNAENLAHTYRTRSWATRRDLAELLSPALVGQA